MSTITIDNNIQSDLEKATKFTGMDEREITERALILGFFARPLELVH